MVNWIETNCQWLVLGGLILMFVSLVVSFLFKTAWGHWHTGRGRKYPKIGPYDYKQEGFRTFDREWRDIE